MNFIYTVTNWPKIPSNRISKSQDDCGNWSSYLGPIMTLNYANTRYILYLPDK